MVYPVISLKPSYNSVIRGCPGIPKTLPRIECQLQIRSNNGLPIKINNIKIMLITAESMQNNFFLTNNLDKNTTFRNNNNNSDNNLNVNNSSNIHTHGDHNGDINAYGDDENLTGSILQRKKNRTDLVTIHYKKYIQVSGKSDNEIIGMDIPLTIALPDDIKDTNLNNKLNCYCYTFLDCKVYYNDQYSKEFRQLINIERFDYLPLSKLFPSIERDTISPNSKFKINYKLNKSCICNDDLLKVEVTLRPNLKKGNYNDNLNNGSNSTGTGLLFNKKRVKLKNVQFQLKEIMEINNNYINLINNHQHPHIKENILKIYTHEVNQVISMNEIKINVDLRIITKDPYYQNFELTQHEPEFLYKLPNTINKIYKGKRNIQTHLLTKDGRNVNIPYQYHTSMTTLGNLFNIQHKLNMIFKLNNGKTIELPINLTIINHSQSQIKYIQQQIQDETEIALYAMKFYNNYGGISKKKLDKLNWLIEYPLLPIVMYHNDSETKERFNLQFNKDLKTNKLIRIPIIE